MTSDGDRSQALAAYRRVVGVKMDALGIDLESALADVPEDMRADLRAEIEAEQRAVSMYYRTGAEVIDGGPRPWFDSWDPNAGYYWRRLREYLVDRKGWILRDVDDLNASSNRVLRHIEDPRTDSPHSKIGFRVQGLVLGYVQSGKTANFTSLIAKAADRGYRLIIVLSGVHNSLRSQTQRRLDLELGLIADPKGVGRPDQEHRWWAITSADLKGDFDPRTDAGPIAQGARGIMVVKKNATVLRRLVNWLEGEVPEDLAALIIDDEADQASINTTPSMEEADLGDDTGDVAPEKELDPSTINGLIRELIGRFRRASYVAYTATPFANVLINPDSESDRWGNDLFPKDFIISLPRPTAYVGAERIFGRPALEEEDEGVSGLDVVRIVPDSELPDLIPKGRAAAAWEPTITDSLRLAMFDWLLASAAKVHRLGDGISSMLVHTTQRIVQQNVLAAAIGAELNLMKQRWRYNRDSIRPTLLERWNTDFRPVTASMDASFDVPFTTVEPYLDDLLGRPDALRMLVLNSESPDLLDYEADNRLKVLLIGGNRLSRGLTLEDLTVSFYVREAATYDTLLQMGRWFGYRSKFVDLTRLWTSQELVSRFRHLSLVEEDLRNQIKIYERENLTPVQVAPKIRAHPDMLVVAKNRMGSAESVRQSYAGELIQMTRFKLDDDAWLEQNLTTARQLLSSLGSPTGAPNGRPQRPAWTRVPWEYVEGFLRNFQTAQDAMSFDAGTAARYIRVQAERYGELTDWTIAVQCGLEEDPKLGLCDLAVHGFGPVPAIGRSRLKADAWSIGALVSPARENNLGSADEAVDLTNAQISSAANLADEFPTKGHALRRQRSSTDGLLLLYPISPASQKGINAKNRDPLFDDPTGRPMVIGIALSFPPSKTGATVEYLAGRPSVRAVKLTEDVG